MTFAHQVQGRVRFADTLKESAIYFRGADRSVAGMSKIGLLAVVILVMRGFLDRMYVGPALGIHYSCTLCPGERAEFYPALHRASGRKVCVRRGGDHGELRGPAGHGKRCPVKEAPNRRGRIGAGGGFAGFVMVCRWYEGPGITLQLLSSNPAEERKPGPGNVLVAQLPHADGIK